MAAGSEPILLLGFRLKGVGLGHGEAPKNEASHLDAIEFDHLKFEPFDGDLVSDLGKLSKFYREPSAAGADAFLLKCDADDFA